MGHFVPILHSQFSPPAAKDRFVHRVQLHKKLQLIPSYPVTIVHASAGYGKSTGLSAYMQYVKMNVCWYSITPYDTDFIPFLVKFVHAVRKIKPEFGERLLNELDKIEFHIQEQEIWSFMAMAINELSQFDEPFIFVMDDTHHFMNSRTISKWIQLFIEHLPNQVHLVVSTRQKPKWSVLSQLKVKGDLLEITQEDLKLSRDEVQHLLQDIYEIDIEEQLVDQIHETTEGWAIACGMFVQQLLSGEKVQNILKKEVTSLQDLFQYMVMEVHSKQPVIIQKFLEQTSVLEVLSEEACDQLLRINSSYQMLEDLAQQNLFIQKIDDIHYRYHALFKVFLENQLRQTDPDEYNHLHHEAAHYYAQQGDLEKAIHHHLIVEDFRRASQLLEKHGHIMIKQGKLERLEYQVKKIPERDKALFPVLWFFEGEILRYRSKYDEAEVFYDQSIHVAKEKKDDYVLSVAYEGKARIYLDTIRPDKAEKILKKAIKYRESLDGSDEERARLYHMLGENLLNAGYAKKAEAWLAKAKSLNLPIDDTNLEARIYLRTGRLNEAKQFLINKKEKFPHFELDHLPQSHRETDILLSIIESFMGNADEGKSYAEKGLQQGIESESPFVEACGWMRMGHAVQLLKRYDSTLAIQCYENALDIMERIDVSRGKAEPYMGLCMLYGSIGEYEKALHAGQKGLHETELVKDLWLSAIIRLCLSVASVHCRRYDHAVKQLKETKEHFKACEDDYGLMATSFWLAYVAFEVEDEALFKEEMDQFLGKMQTGGYEFFIKRRSYFSPIDLQSIAPLLYEAQQKDIHSLYVTRMIHELGFGDLERHPGYTLRIKTLGDFKLYIGNDLVNDSDWSRLKSKELLELLITNRHTSLTKEEIYEALWPGQSEDSANKNFKVTLNGLLKILEPKRQARQESFFILRTGSSYRLNPQSGYELDIELFEEFVQAGIDESDAKKAKELLVRGLTLYEGDYLTNHRAVDWMIHERERLQVLFLRGAERLSQVSVRLEDYHACIHWCQEILYHDRTWEEAYRLLMYCYYQLNNRPQAIKWYKRCEDVLKKELNIEPMQTTKEMYDMISAQI
ncbi:BTAD domain-containing putative transcriptional regulator [Bacillaceae bacterium W0354]